MADQDLPQMQDSLLGKGEREGGQMKTCTKCHIEYPATSEYFYARKTESRLSPCCIPCYKERMRNIYHKNIIDRKAKKRKYYQLNRERILEKQRDPIAKKKREENDKLLSDGLKYCNKCQRILKITEFYSHSKQLGGVISSCKECCKKDNAQRYHTKLKHDPKYKKERSIYAHDWHEKNKIRNNIRNRANHKKLRVLCIEYYGGKCACCGEARYEFMAIDHIDGGGGKHRKTIHTKSFYRWIIKNNFPEGFRILCHNCNQSLGLYGYCPHEKGAKIQN